jgi:penicillin-binding protein 2
MEAERKLILQIIIVLTGIVFLTKLFAIQVLDEDYSKAAEKNTIRRVVEYPYRGLIYDRNGKLIVYNVPEYDLMVIPREMKGVDTLRLCELLGISKLDFILRLTKAKEFSPFLPSIFEKQLSKEDFAAFQDYLVDFPGFYIESRTSRAYTLPIMANALGYISEVSKGQLERDTVKYYRQGDYIGQSGLEAHYEKFLRGKRGVKYKIKNVKGIDKGSFEDGRFDTLSIVGENLISTIHLDLQAYGEKLLAGKAGSVVAIEPSTGEILAFISGPSYDPNLLTGRLYSQNYLEISRDSLKPLFNRPLMAMYPPGSIFKMVQALIALEEGVISPHTVFPCNRALVNCHNHPNPTNLHGAIQYSCNPYFFQTFRKVINQDVAKNTFTDSRIGLDNWKQYVGAMGLGGPLGIDLPNEKGGSMPGSSLYDRIYGHGRWKFSTIYSLSIGQGEMLVTPLQMANLAAIIANKGHYYIPHMVKSISGEADIDPKYRQRRESGIASEHFEVVHKGMADAIYGTAGRAAISDIKIAGKTGTAENFGIINGKRVQLPDHSVFMAFAPLEDPKIAISVYVENAGWGGRAAASIASLMIERYVRGHVTRPSLEEYVLKGQFIY